MVQWFSARSRTLAASMVLALATLSASAAVPHADDCHAAECAGVLGPHSADSHRAGAPSSHEPHEHCAVCHGVRAFRHSAPAIPGSVTCAEDDERIAPRVFAPPLVFPAAQPPLRSPPVTPVLV